MAENQELNNIKKDIKSIKNTLMKKDPDRFTDEESPIEKVHEDVKDIKKILKEKPKEDEKKDEKFGRSFLKRNFLMRMMSGVMGGIFGSMLGKGLLLGGGALLANKLVETLAEKFPAIFGDDGQSEAATKTANKQIQAVQEVVKENRKISKMVNEYVEKGVFTKEESQKIEKQLREFKIVNIETANLSANIAGRSESFEERRRGFISSIKLGFENWGKLFTGKADEWELREINRAEANLKRLKEKQEAIDEIMKKMIPIKSDLMITEPVSAHLPGTLTGKKVEKKGHLGHGLDIRMFEDGNPEKRKFGKELKEVSRFLNGGIYIQPGNKLRKGIRGGPSVAFIFNNKMYLEVHTHVNPRKDLKNGDIVNAGVISGYITLKNAPHFDVKFYKFSNEKNKFVHFEEAKRIEKYQQLAYQSDFVKQLLIPGDGDVFIKGSEEAEFVKKKGKMKLKSAGTVAGEQTYRIIKFSNEKVEEIQTNVMGEINKLGKILGEYSEDIKKSVESLKKDIPKETSKELIKNSKNSGGSVPSPNPTD